MKAKDRLTTWEWETLVASWRYFQYGHSISSASFPGDILNRFWSEKGQKKWSTKVRMTIARQFVEVDHGIRGVSDWEVGSCEGMYDLDSHIWRRFYTFLKCYLHTQFLTVTVSNGKKTEVVRCFRYEGDLVPVDCYIFNPSDRFWIPEEFVKEVK